MDSKLNIAFLWHQHQPYYKVIQPDGRTIYQMPWVRLHAVKDYYDLPRWMDDFPALKQNFNLVPSLLIQLEDYAVNRAEDRVIQLTQIHAEELTEADKENILKTFFLANQKRLIFPNLRYRELWEKKERREMFSVQDFTDLQVWYNLCWVGEYWKKQEPFKTLFKKGKYFSLKDKQDVVDGHYSIMGEVVPLYRRLVQEHKIELSVTPFYHPILPLLCDTNVAQKKGNDTEGGAFSFKHPEDAEQHIQKSVRYFEQLFGFTPSGMWPSEGSVSDEALQKIAEAGFEWVATDQEILENSDVSRSDKNICLPHTWEGKGQNLNLIFRDHALSDAIGFKYAEMDPEEAAHDFISEVERIRMEMLNQNKNPSAYLLNVILDGENCWEFYLDNGAPFLKALYRRLSESSTVRSVTIGDFLKRAKAEGISLPKITRLHAGSWINHNFDIWIGSHKEKNTAWQYLKETRDFLVAHESNVPKATAQNAWEEIYLAEGSDWFWWFGDDHHAENKFEFDTLFRYHLIRVYDLLNVAPPSNLTLPIMSLRSAGAVFKVPTAFIRPRIDGRISHFYEWTDAGYYEAHQDGDTMHISDRWVRKMYYGFDADSVYFRVDFYEDVTDKFKHNEDLALQFEFISIAKLIFTATSSETADQRPVNCRHKLDRIFEAQISLESLNLKPGQTMELVLSVFEKDREIVRRPSRTPLRLTVPDETSDKYLWSV